MAATLSRTGKPVKLTQSIQLMANERNQADTAVAGDVIGIYDTGTYQIGDTLTTAKEPFAFEPLPTFPPELFALVQPKDTMKAKQFHKGVKQLAQEGAIQVYRNIYNEVILGAVGQLQFEVFQYRVENEYNAPLRMNPLDYTLARWIPKEQEDQLKACLDSRSMLVYDRFERPLILFANLFTLRYFQERFPFARLMEALELTEDMM
jgi:peptide chain release factor 3